MFSLQKLLGKDDRFFELLEASAEEARQSVQKLNQTLKNTNVTPTLDGFHELKEADKRITAQINEALVNTFVSQLEREDIEVLSAALYKIPKTVEKIAERFIISATIIRGTDFSRHTELMDAATQRVVHLVKLLRGLGSGQLEEAKRLNSELQQVEGDADKLILEILKDLYSGRHEATKVIALKDIFELLEKVIDRCRDAGNVVTHIVLKNA
ncbi:MAG: DUF47 family protein [Verrucomicrobia bacterium]|nr:DUF47 family protein [Verrucomicrobiota bacterium]MBI3868856.1 DUF47 family protein [Verrucomicrobiota bacterium]